MSEAASESTDASAQGQADEQSTEETAAPTLEDLQAQIAELTKNSRKWEERAKANGGAAKAAEQARLDAMSESERAIEEARQSARAEAASTFGQRLARTEFDNLAGRRNPGFDTASALEYVDLGKFLDESGEPDTAAIKAAVDRLVPEANDGPPSFDGGTRTVTKAADFNTELRRAAGRG